MNFGDCGLDLGALFGGEFMLLSAGARDESAVEKNSEDEFACSAY